MASSLAYGSKGTAPLRGVGLDHVALPPVSSAVALSPANRVVRGGGAASFEAPSQRRHGPSPSIKTAARVAVRGVAAGAERFRCLGASDSSQFLATGPSPPQWGSETEPAVASSTRTVFSGREGLASGALVSSTPQWQAKHGWITSRELQRARTRVQRPGRRHATRIFAQVVAPEGPRESVAPPAPSVSVSESPLPSRGCDIAAPALLPTNPDARIQAAPLVAPSTLPSSIILAQTEEERRACAIMRAQLLYAYPLDRAPEKGAPNRDAEAITSVCSSLESRTNAEYTRDSTLKLLSLPVLSFLVYSTSEEVFCTAEQRQHELLHLSHPACKPLLVCPQFSISDTLPLGSPFQFGAPQHNAIGLATLDLQLPAYPGDMPLGPSDSMKKRKAQQQRQSGLTDKFSTWLTPSRPKTSGPTFGDMTRAEGLGLSDSNEENEENEVGPTGAYIFNLCVSQVFRRQGLARKLLTYVAAYAKEVQGLDCLRMHAECSNLAAVTLYKSLGFRAEYEETEQEAALLRRPRRVLFRLTF